ncbi:MAG: hypothetical protein JWL77_6792 [Chthonomonadaceae bacterium]|nr:hypothetical protein [Chthonomonadaceae bacterium]
MTSYNQQKMKKLLETHSQRATNSKPVGTYTKKELIALEHEWRLKLKASGFSDIEMWDNSPRKHVKKLKFIKGHIRKHRYDKYTSHITENVAGIGRISNDKYKEMRKFWKGYKLNAQDTYEYYRIIGLFSHHAPKTVLPEKYRKLLQYYATCGVCSEAIRKAAPTIKASAIEMYLKRNFKKMIEFVNTLNRESLDSYDQRN